MRCTLRTPKLIVVVMTVLALDGPGARAAYIAQSNGRSDLVIEYAGNLPTSATGDVISVARAGDLHGGVNDFVGTYNGNAINGVATSPTVKAGLFAGQTFDGVGAFNYDKFPAERVLRGDMTVIQLLGVDPIDSYYARGDARWESSEISTFASTTRRARMVVSAAANRNGEATKETHAFAKGLDPWVFTPTTPMDLTVSVTLSDIMLQTSADSGALAVANMAVYGGLGIGEVPGENGLASWDWFREIAGDDSYTLPDTTIFQQTFTLSPGQTYWLVHDHESFAYGVPEPATIGCLAIGVFLLRRARRQVAS